MTRLEYLADLALKEARDGTPRTIYIGDGLYALAVAEQAKIGGGTEIEFYGVRFRPHSEHFAKINERHQQRELDLDVPLSQRGFGVL